MMNLNLHAHDKDGQLITMADRDRLFAFADYRVVARHETAADDPNAAHNVLISTIWTGLDAAYGLSPDGPHIFETGIYGTIAGEPVTMETTSATLDAALLTHKAALDAVRDMVVDARQATINRDRWLTRQALGEHDPDQSPIPGYTDAEA